eukprot:gb/GECG01015881.1/.p1 GENE.gb/GECG01015881.1/~~gb/GECG01015881.1/.p1  ORF type:complete len:1150 (+),score=214.30 gb/GECG01015881.1/:1-3450(+)
MNHKKSDDTERNVYDTRTPQSALMRKYTLLPEWKKIGIVAAISVLAAVTFMYLRSSPSDRPMIKHSLTRDEKEQLAARIREEERARFEREYQSKLWETQNKMNDVRSKIQDTDESSQVAKLKEQLQELEREYNEQSEQLEKDRANFEKGLSGIISKRLREEQNELLEDGSKQLLSWFCTFDSDEGESFPDLNDEVVAEYEDTTTSPVDISDHQCVGVAQEDDQPIEPSLHKDSDVTRSYYVAEEALKSLKDKNENLLGYEIAGSAYDPGSPDFMEDCTVTLFAVHPVFGAFYKIKLALRSTSDTSSKEGAAKVIGEPTDSGKPGEIVTRSVCYHRKWVAKPIVKPQSRNARITHLMNPEELPKAGAAGQRSLVDARALKGKMEQSKKADNWRRALDTPAEASKSNSKLTVQFILPFRASNLNTLPQLIRSLEIADKVRRSDEQASKSQPLVRLIMVKLDGEENAPSVKGSLDLKQRITDIVNTALKSVHFEIKIADPLPPTKSSAQHIKDLTKEWVNSHYAAVNAQGSAKKTEEELKEEDIAATEGNEKSVHRPTKKKGSKKARKLEDPSADPRNGSPPNQAGGGNPKAQQQPAGSNPNQDNGANAPVEQQGGQNAADTAANQPQAATDEASRKQNQQQNLQNKESVSQEENKMQSATGENAQTPGQSQSAVKGFSMAKSVLPNRWLSAVLGGLVHVPFGRSIVFMLDSSTATVSASLAKKTLWRVIEGRQVLAPIPYALSGAYTDDDMTEAFRDDGGASAPDSEVTRDEEDRSKMQPFQMSEFYTEESYGYRGARFLRHKSGSKIGGRSILAEEMDDYEWDDPAGYTYIKGDDDYSLTLKDDAGKDFTGLEDDAIAQAEKEMGNKDWMKPYAGNALDDIVDDYPQGGAIVDQHSEDDDQEALAIDEPQWQRLTLLGTTKVDLAAAIYRMLAPATSETSKRNLEEEGSATPENNKEITGEKGDACMMRRILYILMSNNYNVARAPVAGLRVKSPENLGSSSGQNRATELSNCECDYANSNEEHCLFRLAVSAMDDDNDKMRVQCAVSQIHTAILNSKNKDSREEEGVGRDELGDFEFREVVGVHHPVRFFDPSRGTEIVAKVTAKDYLPSHDAPTQIPLAAEVFSFRWALSENTVEFSELEKRGDDWGW